jgi:hypothetical protein
MSRAYCEEGQHFPEELIAQAHYEDTVEFIGSEVGVIQNNDGSSTNRYADGIVGVTPEIQEIAAVDDEPVCAEHPDCYVKWIHDDQ